MNVTDAFVSVQRNKYIVCFMTNNTPSVLHKTKYNSWCDETIRSLRSWATDRSSHDVLHLLAATEDDLRMNAEYIRLADKHIIVEEVKRA